ncbi:MAG: hypothetical protein ABFS09_13090 [Thermodesulfobacteriota bacterium]
MEIREGSRSRNNMLIFLTAGVVLLLIILSLLQSQQNTKVVKISVGDSSFQVANMLSREGVVYKPLEGKEGIIVDYIPANAFARLNKKHTGSRYEIHFAEGKVVKIIWRAKDNRQLASLLFVKVVAKL